MSKSAKFLEKLITATLPHQKQVDTVVKRKTLLYTTHCRLHQKLNPINQHKFIHCHQN